jgi:archaellum biogenesis ATPase FlaH
VLPHLKLEYFNSDSTNVIEGVIFEELDKFYNTYNTLPTRQALLINIDKANKLTAEEFDEAANILDDFEKNPDKSPEDWLIKETEKFASDQAIYIGIRQSIKIFDECKNPKSKLDKGMIPKLLSDALAVSFDNRIGHNYLADYEERYAFFHKRENKFAFDIDKLNSITQGGIPRKTLTIIVGGVNVGKSLCLCHFATSYLKQNYNVLYITLEMSEEQISKRIDANFLDVSIDNIETIPKTNYVNLINKAKAKVTGKLVIKEFPTSSAHVGHFKSLLNELNIKEQFKPDIIIVDYLNICSSSRIKNTGDSYSYIKVISEELRGLAVEENVALLTGTQLNRKGFGDGDPGLGDVAESFGLTATADLILGIVTNEKLELLNQYMMKQMKNRFGSKNVDKKFFVGVDIEKMRLYNLDSGAANPFDDEDDDLSSGVKFKHNGNTKRNRTSNTISNKFEDDKPNKFGEFSFD